MRGGSPRCNMAVAVIERDDAQFKRRAALRSRAQLSSSSSPRSAGGRRRRRGSLFGWRARRPRGFRPNNHGAPARSPPPPLPPRLARPPVRPTRVVNRIDHIYICVTHDERPAIRYDRDPTRATATHHDASRSWARPSRWRPRRRSTRRRTSSRRSRRTRASTRTRTSRGRLVVFVAPRQRTRSVDRR